MRATCPLISLCRSQLTYTHHTYTNVYLYGNTMLKYSYITLTDFYNDGGLLDQLSDSSFLKKSLIDELLSMFVD
jgi:hypothetical protein